MGYIQIWNNPIFKPHFYEQIEKREINNTINCGHFCALNIEIKIIYVWLTGK